MLGQLKVWATAVIVALVIASSAFVAVRNTELAERQIDSATRAVDTVVGGKAPLPGPHVAIVGPAIPSPTRAYLKRRTMRELGDGAVDQPLTAAAGPDAKLFYDAATRFDRGELATGELLTDGSGRAIAVRRLNIPAPDVHTPDVHAHAPDVHTPDVHTPDVHTPDVHTPDVHTPDVRAPDVAHTAGALVIALTPPARPAPYPGLVIVGVLGLGIALAAAGALVGGRARHVGLFAGIAALAIPCALWQTPIAAAAIVILAALVALASARRLTDQLGAGMRAHRTALGFLAPAAIAMLVLVLAPFAIGIVLGFYDHHHGTWTFVGLSNFGEILSGGGRPLDDPLNFWFILGVTVLWTVCNIMLHVTIGVLLALALSRKWLYGRGVFRMLFILPWAIPNYITALIWKGMFTGEYGAVNSILHFFGLSDVSWFGSWATAFSANVITNTWLGFPFMMVVALGALESIPRELYEAASVDGASTWQRFRHITLPHLRPALGPAVALGSIWTFNMFNVIFLVSAGAPGGSTNILVTDAYRWAFERGERYGMSAAYATIIFLVLLLWTVFGNRIARRSGSGGDDS